MKTVASDATAAVAAAFSMKREGIFMLSSSMPLKER